MGQQLRTLPFAASIGAFVVFTLALPVAHAQPPAWSRSESLKAVTPLQRLKVTGPKAPKGLALVKGRGSVTLKAKGPGKLVLFLYPLTLKRGGSGSVSLEISVGKRKLPALAMDGTSNTDWVLPNERLFALGRFKKRTVILAHENQEVTLAPGPDMKLGFAFSAFVKPAEGDSAVASKDDDDDDDDDAHEPSADDAKAMAAQNQQDDEDDAGSAPPLPPPPPIPDGSQNSSDGGQDAIASAQPGPEPEIPADQPSAEVPLGNMAMVKDAARVTVNAPDGSAEPGFLLLWGEEGITLEMEGPGTLQADFHALREAPSSPEADASPLIVALLVDSVLHSTIALDQVDSHLKSQGLATVFADGDNLILAKRARLELPIPPGVHRVQLSPSDNATRGVLVRPFFDAGLPVSGPSFVESAPLEPTPTVAVQADPAQSTNATDDRLWLEGDAGLFAPRFLRRPGASFSVRARVPVAALGDGFTAGLSLGMHFLGQESHVIDLRVPEGQSAVNTAVTLVPVLAEGYWGFPLPAGLQLNAGLGVGVVLTMASTESMGTRRDTALAVAPATQWNLAVERSLGPGQIYAMVSYLAALVVDTPSLAELSPSGLRVAVGFSWGEGQSGRRAATQAPMQDM